ncbi:MAG: hypothetical protein PHH49_07905 [Candidatus Omnitrophica bacterium]|nr:hypothetical protein [Candidatus Omnitrophota bacterium]MDD5488861.1 hypothetical protein [Candidatus Omnitrophota bacterium]
MGYVRKVLVVISVIMCLVPVSAMAADHTTLNSSNIEAFIGIFPEYKAFLENYGENASEDGVDPAMGLKMKNELDGLCAKYGMTMPEFTELAQKVSMGYSALQMRNSGMDPNAMNLMQMVSEEEVSALKPYEARLNDIFNE